MSEYCFYFPDLIEQWQEGDFEGAAKGILARDNASLVIFCCDLYHLPNPNLQLAQIAGEVAVIENLKYTVGEATDLIENLLDRWDEAWIVKDDKGLTKIGYELLNYPRCYLLIMASALLFSKGIEGIFHVGLLAGVMKQIATSDNHI